jgi:hypothetical protein
MARIVGWYPTGLGSMDRGVNFQEECEEPGK